MTIPHKPRVKRKFIGGYQPRIDGQEKAQGKPLYADFREGNPTLVALETYARLDGKRQAEF